MINTDKHKKCTSLKTNALFALKDALCLQKILLNYSKMHFKIMKIQKKKHFSALNYEKSAEKYTF